mgnify:CR=1 FL=1
MPAILDKLFGTIPVWVGAAIIKQIPANKFKREAEDSTYCFSCRIPRNLSFCALFVKGDPQFLYCIISTCTSQRVWWNQWSFPYTLIHNRGRTPLPFCLTTLFAAGTRTSGVPVFILCGVLAFPWQRTFALFWVPYTPCPSTGMCTV